MIKLNSVYIESYDQYKHAKLVRKLTKDEGVYRYISKNFSDWINKSSDELNREKEMKSYVIYNSDKENVGMCGFNKIYSNNVVELWCAIDSSYRNNGYAEKTLVGITSYLLDNVKDLSNIKIVINKNNVASNKVANNSGYSLVDTYDNKNVYTYFK